MHRLTLPLIAALVFAAVPPAPAQDNASRREPFDAFRIVGNMYYVGTRGLASILFTTAEGHILLDTGLDTSGALLRASIERIGMRPADIRILLEAGSHRDFASGFEHLFRPLVTMLHE